jgi:hypothetical protein
MYASLPGTSGALHLDVFDQPAKFLRNLVARFTCNLIAITTSGAGDGIPRFKKRLWRRTYEHSSWF